MSEQNRQNALEIMRKVDTRRELVQTLIKITVLELEAWAEERKEEKHRKENETDPCLNTYLQKPPQKSLFV